MKHSLEVIAELDHVLARMEHEAAQKQSQDLPNSSTALVATNITSNTDIMNAVETTSNSVSNNTSTSNSVVTVTATASNNNNSNTPSTCPPVSYFSSGKLKEIMSNNFISKVTTFGAGFLPDEDTLSRLKQIDGFAFCLFVCLFVCLLSTFF